MQSCSTTASTHCIVLPDGTCNPTLSRTKSYLLSIKSGDNFERVALVKVVKSFVVARLQNNFIQQS